MSQILKGFVDALNQIHKGDLEVLGVTADGTNPGVGWEELPSPTFPGGPDGERIFVTNLSRLGIGWDEKARVLYFGVEFSKENLVAEPGKAARTKTVLDGARRYKGGIILNPGPVFQSLEVRDDAPNTPLVKLL